MEPARLARLWTRRLPGAATLAIDRAALELAAESPALEPATEPDPASPEPRLGTLERGLRRRGGLVRTELRSLRAALGRADVAAAATHLATARATAAPLADPVVEAWIELFAAEIAYTQGATDLAARLSCAAEAAARRADDAPTFLAVWWVRAVRALRRGDGGDGAAIAGWMDAWLATVAPRHRCRLRCFEAAFALDDDRPADAIAAASEIVSLAPGSTEAALCGTVITQAFLALDRATDAARVATACLDRCAGAPAGVRAQLYLDAAIALAATGLDDAAARCAEVAHRLDPRVGTDATAIELAGLGIEVLLL